MDAIEELYKEESPLEGEITTYTFDAGDEKVYEELCTAADSFKLEGSFCFEGAGSFGLAFDYDEGEEDYKLISIDPEDSRLRLQFKGGKATPAEEKVDLTAGENYDFTYIQEDSVGVFYIGDTAAFTVRLYGVGGKPLYLFAEDCDVVFSDLSLFVR
ncbi:MAG: DUF4975 domain-containing protein [Lachnospiraceae bacterium]|nr:DUF4975 domain-containing protein [Lachnospiraceae bacterium]